MNTPTAKIGLQFDLSKIGEHGITEHLRTLKDYWPNGLLYTLGLPKSGSEPNTATYWFHIPFGRVVEFERAAIREGGGTRIVRESTFDHKIASIG